MVPLLPNSLFTSLHAVLEPNGVALIAVCRLPRRREELLSLVGAGMFQHLALCCLSAVQGAAKKARATMALFQGFIGKDGPNVACNQGISRPKKH